jgi:3-phenylpropionate/trans-cinnamate dioxygenase ferredoxin subunit
MSDFVTVAKVGDVSANGLVGLVVEDRPIVLVEQDGEIFALEDRCSHEEFPLSSGECESGEITCVLHGARFNVRTGAPTALPAVMPVKTYEVRIEGDDVQVKLDG